jgi:hypothetical protein
MERVGFGSLWDGFDKVLLRSEEARADLKMIKQFLADRARIELEYGQSLQKLAASLVSPFLPRAESVASFFHTAKVATESLGKQHIQTANILQNE